MNLNGRRYGHIRVERILGQGGMGNVYEGFDEKLTRRVALKVLHRESQLDAEARGRLTREARTLSQLDHPNICRIYDFIEDDHADVLVLELIDGRTLEEALHDNLSITEKLRIAHDVASVLVAAHRAGILHRDLKPENVMLTKSGEVKVLDFGLARWLEAKSGTKFPALGSAAVAARLHVIDERDESWIALDDAATTIAPAPPPDNARVNATEHGITVGTPLFMSPEQARGEPLTTASDIYSFGLMLQTMFTGRDAYPEGLSSREVMLRAARGDSLAVIGVRHDIAVLIKAFKQFAPSDRPTAVDALRRIKHIVGTPRRRLQNAAVAALAVLMLLGVWKYTIDLRRERAAAQQAAAEAKRRRADADSLIGFMLNDLRTKLEPVGKLDILDDVGKKSLAYMASLDPKTLTAEELARNSQALYQIGEVRATQGNLTAAIEVFKQALDLAVEAHARAPKDPKAALAVGTAHFWIGNASLMKGDTAAALAEMKEYRRIAEELAIKYPTEDQYQLERAYGHSVVAKALEMQGDLPGSAVEYRIAEKVKLARAGFKPDDAERQADLAVTLNNLGFVLERLGNLAEARRYYEREFAIFDSLVKLDPKNTKWKDRLANNHSYLAALLENVGDIDGALAHRTAGLALYRDLAAHDPTNADWQRAVAVALNRRGDLLRTRGRVDEAVADLTAALSQMQAVLNRDPKRKAWLRDRAIIQITQARVLLAAGRAAAAHSAISAAVATLTDVDAKVAVKLQLACAHIVLGDCELATGDRASAENAWKTAVGLLHDAVTRPDPKIGAMYAQALIRLGRAGEARPVIAAVRRTGYGQFDFVQASKAASEK
jgi:serine/threonine protein kinase